MVEYLKIPKERLRLLLQDDKKILKQIEKYTGTKIEINEEEQIEILETEKMNDPLSTWKARDTIKAIGRGFDPEIAFRLLEENCELKIIDLSEFVGKKKNALTRIKGRIIGTKGKAKKRIEDMTNSNISVYGKTIAVISPVENVDIAAKAVEMLASGRMHSTVWKMISRELAK